MTGAVAAGAVRLRISGYPWPSHRTILVPIRATLLAALASRGARRAQRAGCVGGEEDLGNILLAWASAASFGHGEGA